MLELNTNKQLVFAGSFWHGASGGGLAYGFRDLGWSVSEVELRDYLMRGNTLTLRLAARALRSQCVASYNKAILDSADIVRPTALLTVKGNCLRAETLADIRRRGILTINYYPDFDFDDRYFDSETFRQYDVFFTTKSFHIAYLRAILDADRVRLLHHGYSPLVHRPHLLEVAESDYITDVLYVGNHTAYKEQWLNAVTQSLPNISFLIVGNGWIPAAARLGRQTRVLARHILGDNYAELVQRARINLAIHSGPSERNHWEDFVSTRTFEIPACKGFMLHIDNEEVRKLFEPGQEFDVFSSPEELCAKIQFYLARPELRRDMIERAFARAVPDYSYAERARVIADTILASRSV